MEEKKAFLRLIKSNIENHKYHLTTVNSTLEPRYAYTIGLSVLFDFELIFAGGAIYLKDELSLIFDAIVEELSNDKSISSRNISVGSLGSFSLCTVDSSWSKLMMLGVFDYYKTDHITALQIIPDSGHSTLDIPDMTKDLNRSLDPVWQWLIRKWDYAAPEDSTVVTNIKALLGEVITEVMRWEDNAWEMFAGDGSEVQKDDVRVVSLGTILGIDRTLLPVINLDVGKGLWRESVKSDWNNWG